MINKTNKPKLSILTIDFGMGGTERFISLLLPELVKDFEVTLVIFYNYIHFDIPKEVNLIILKPDTKKSKSYIFKLKNFTNLFIQYKRFIKKEGIDISFSLLPIPNIINSFVAIGNKKVRTVISERCYPSLMYKGSRLQMFLAKVFFPLLYNRTNVLFSNSEYINKDLKENFGVKIPTKVIYNPITTNENEKIDSETIKGSKTLNIINAGTIYSAKNQKLILEAMGLSPSGEFKLTILGNGELKEDLITLSEQLNISNHLILEGKVSNVKEYLLNSDCFVLSSNTEGFPNVLLEALSVGLPSISTNCLSGPQEMLNDNEAVTIESGDFYKAKYGILVNVDDKEGLNKAMLYLKNNPEERQRYSQLGFERAKTYGLPKIYEQVKSLLNN
ncbi:glycosyl transferase [Aquaticitalea lipolytica]|uniref:Glycosyl transferase n=1 Tax=Aquaticitalea lipolytica TaxID=1247562 RepID=A0A8J2TQF4_9FLAO|nr:glycosyltransferase [Aquaticitalea lipolytica]GFZ85277.1 glycosyl transferase [Aquaticitalea lipolytica]